MKIPRFTLGLFTGILLCLAVLAFLYNYLFFSYPNGYYESSTTPFYIVSSDPKYPEFKLLESDEYWDALSLSAVEATKSYCDAHDIDGTIKVHCVGSPQGYSIYYSIGGHASAKQLLSRDKIKAIIVSHVDSDYSKTLNLITMQKQSH